MGVDKMDAYWKDYEFRERLSDPEKKIRAINMYGEQWHIEIASLLHGLTKVGTGLFYKCIENKLTLKLFESLKESGLDAKGNSFMLLLRLGNSSEIYDSVGITKTQFEQITGLKALTEEEYFEKCESVPHFDEIGATLIDLSSL